MSLESATYISDLNASNPAATDQLKQADDHIRLLKSVLKATFPNITGPVEATQDDLNVSVPIGVIVAWYGSSGSVPSGWHVCDGTTGITRSDGSGTINVPDLRDRTIVGVKTAGIVATVGATAGATTAAGTSDSQGAHTHSFTGAAHTHTFTDDGHVLTVSEMPAHQHGNGLSNNSTQAFFRGTQAAVGNGDIQTDGSSATLEGLTESKGGGASHSHSGTTASGGGDSGTTGSNGAHTHSTTVSTVQPSYGLHWIMKV